MAELQQQLIWLGAGTARQPALNFNAFSQVTLVEAREEACIALQQAYSQPNISVLQQLISAEAESQSFISYNLAEFSAISPIAGLKDLFPGLKTKSQERLQSQAVKVLIDQINTNQPLQPKANTLIIDIPDQAHSLLSKLIQTKQLTLFNTLVIPYGAELYAGMADIAVITELLNKEHFVLQSTDNSDPDLPLYSFKLDAAAKKVAQLNHKVKQLTEQLAAAQQSEANNRQQLEQQKAELTKQLEAAKQQASADKQQLEQQRAELSKQLEAAKQQAAADKQQLEQQKAELRKQLEAAKQQVSTEKQQLEQQKAELTKQLEAAKQQASTEKQQLEQQKAELTKQLEAAKQQAATEKQQSEQQKAELGKQLEAAKQQAATEKQQSEQQKAELGKQLEAAKQQAATEKQQSEQQKAELSKQLEAAKQQASTDKQQLEQQKAELTKQLEAAKQQASADKQQLEQQKAELTKQLEAAKQQASADKQQLEQQKAELTKQLEAAKQQASTDKQQLEQQKEELTKQLEASRQQLAELKQQAEQANAAKSELTNQLETSQQQLVAQKQQTEQANIAKVELAKQLEANQQQLFGLVEQKIQQLLADQTTKLVSEVQNAKNSLSWVIGNSAKQVESFIAIQNYLEKGVKPLSFHGWPISPDIGLYITGLIDADNYDVIIEFGSGTSTVLMAKALQAKQRGVERKSITDRQVKSEGSTPLAFEDYTDLPARIVSFEHNNKYHAQTLQAVKNNGVDYLVNLVHAPLVDYQYKDGTEYLYYSCTETLQDIAKIFKGRKANILVLVDGPPGSTNKNARFPCLPHLLKALPNHSYTIVMDDYGRAEEKEITELWRKILEERSYSVSVETIANEKGLAILRVD